MRALKLARKFLKNPRRYCEDSRITILRKIPSVIEFINKHITERFCRTNKTIQLDNLNKVFVGDRECLNRIESINCRIANSNRESLLSIDKRLLFVNKSRSKRMYIFVDSDLLSFRPIISRWFDGSCLFIDHKLKCASQNFSCKAYNEEIIKNIIKLINKNNLVLSDVTFVSSGCGVRLLNQISKSLKSSNFILFNPWCCNCCQDYSEIDDTELKKKYDTLYCFDILNTEINTSIIYFPDTVNVKREIEGISTKFDKILKTGFNYINKSLIFIEPLPGTGQTINPWHKVIDEHYLRFLTELISNKSLANNKSCIAMLFSTYHKRIVSSVK